MAVDEERARAPAAAAPSIRQMRGVRLPDLHADVTVSYDASVRRPTIMGEYTGEAFAGGRGRAETTS